MKFFEKVTKVQFEGAKSQNPFAFKFYNAQEVIQGKTMKEQLRYAMSYWHTLCGDGTDMFGRGTIDKSFGGKDAISIYENKAKVAFELMDILDIDYFCFHDRDIAPECGTLAKTNEALDHCAGLVKKLMNETGKKLLWGTANCFSHPRYVHGAGTSPNADVFAFAAAQIKKALELTVELGGEGYVFWGGREGYETLLNTNLGLEQDNLARLLKLAVDYGRSIGFQGDFYIEPKPKEPTKHQYDFDVSTVLAFLRKYNLEKDFKMNIEANHATLAGHTFQHELRVARENGVFGSVDANMGDLLLGWDTDQFPTDVYDATWCMYEVLKSGGFTKGGLNFDAKTRRGSFTMDDILHAYIAGMDTFALGLKMADKIIRDGRIEEQMEKRYASFNTGIGAKIMSGSITIEELEKHAIELGEVSSNESSRQEYLESILNTILFS